MDKLISVEFVYKDKPYYALIRFSSIQREKQYHITILNGDLEKLAQENKVLVEEDGAMRLPDEMTEAELEELKIGLATALYQYLKNKGEFFQVNRFSEN